MPIPVGSPTTIIPTGPGRPGESLQQPSLTLGDITLGVTDDFGVRWDLSDLKGWWGPATITDNSEQRANDHGVWLSPSYYAGRMIEVTGALEAGTWDGAFAALRRLSTAVPLSVLAPLYVSDGLEVLTAMVRQGGDLLPTFSESLDGVIEFSLSLLAPDPRRYSPELVTAQTGLPSSSGGLTLPLTLPLTVAATSTSGVLRVTNEGNMSTRPVLTVEGPAPAGAITHLGTGKTLRFSEAVPAGRSLVIDTDRRRALLDGVAPRVVTGTWFDYSPGVNEVAFSAATYDSSALLVSEHRSAWR